jgi:competence protein ComEC
MSQEKTGKYRSGSRLLLVLALVTVAVWVWAVLPHQPVLSVTFLDVRQGDSAVIRTPGGKTILIDAGGRDAGSRVVVPFLRRNGIGALDLVVMTHPHEDHIGGMPAVLKSTRARVILDSAAPHASGDYEETLRLIHQKRIRYVRAYRGQRITFPDGVRFNTLNPPKSQSSSGQGESELNDRSVVLRMTYKAASFLFAGDAEKETEQSILGSCGSVRSNVLKVAHHGSENATSELWLRAVKPEIAVISVGWRNQFGHPSPDTLRHLADAGARIYRTDRNGAITITTDGKELHVSTTRKRR